MAIWTTEIKQLEHLYESLKSQFPDLEKGAGAINPD